MSDALEAFLADLPRLHTWDKGQTWRTGGFSPQGLRELHGLIAALGRPPRIIETGAGNSTLLFLLTAPAELVSIAPDAALFERIREHAASRGIATRPLTAILDRSETALPALLAAQRPAFDVGLIDGGHGWPTPFVDFCYINALLRKDGLLAIDDVQLHSVKELARFLAKDPRFRLERRIGMGKTLVFRKTVAHRFLPDFAAQPYIVERTEADKAANRAYALD